MPPIPIGRARERRGTKSREHHAVAVRGRAPSFARQTFLQRMHDQRAHQSGVSESHFRLRGMDIGVDLLRVCCDEQRHHRMTVARQVIGIGRAHRAQNQLVTHRTAVDEQILAERIRAGQRRRGSEPLDDYALAFGAHRDGRGTESPPRMSPSRAQSSRRSRQRRRPGRWRTPFACEGKTDIRPRHCQPPHHLADRLGFRPIGLEEFQPCGVALKEIG